MTITTKRIFLFALSALLALALTTVALPKAAHAENEVTITGTTAIEIALDGTKGSTTLTASACTGTHADGTTSTINWSSDNTNVATVSGGVVTAVAPGTANITAACSVDAAHKATVPVTVTQKTENTSVSFPTQNFTALNQELTFTATPNPANVAGTYVWSVGNGLTIVEGGSTATVKVKSVTAGASSIKVVFTPTNTNYKPSEAIQQVSITDNSPALSLSATGTSYTASGVTGAVTATIANPGTGTWNYSYTCTSGPLEITSTGANNNVYTVNYKTAKDGTATVEVTAVNGSVTLKKSIQIKVDLPDPYLTLSVNHHTLSLSRTRTTVYAKLTNANSAVPNDSRIYWETSNSKVATVSGASKYMKSGEAEATVYAKGNGKAVISARTRDGHVVDSIEIVVENYKTIPQTGQDTRLIYVEVAALMAVLATAGVVYARKRKKNEQ